MAGPEPASRGLTVEVRQILYLQSNGWPLEEFEQLTDQI